MPGIIMFGDGRLRDNCLLVMVVMEPILLSPPNYFLSSPMMELLDIGPKAR